MADMRKLFGSKPNATLSTAPASVSGTSAGSTNPAKSDDAGSSEQLSSSSQESTPAGRTNESSTPKLVGLFGVKKSGGSGAAPATTESSRAGSDSNERLTGSVQAPESSAGRTIASLDDLDNSGEDDSIAPTTRHSGFADEIPAQAPIRTLPEDLDSTAKQFVDLIDGVYMVLDDPELLGGVIRNIMIELKSNKQYMKLVADEDIHVWVRAMRENMGLAQIRKQEKATNRKSGSSRASKMSDADMLADLAELEGL